MSGLILISIACAVVAILDELHPSAFDVTLYNSMGASSTYQRSVSEYESSNVMMMMVMKPAQ